MLKIFLDRAGLCTLFVRGWVVLVSQIYDASVFVLVNVLVFFLETSWKVWCLFAFGSLPHTLSYGNFGAFFATNHPGKRFDPLNVKKIL